MKTLLTLFVLLFSSSVFAEQYLQCTNIENKFVNTFYEEFLGNQHLFIKLFDVRILGMITTPEKMDSKEIKEFYKNNPLKALEFYEDNTFKKIKEQNEYNSFQAKKYSRLTVMMQIEDLDVLFGEKENPLNKYYVLYANLFRKSLFQKIVIINRYTLRAFIINDYRRFINSELKFAKLKNLTDELIDKNYPSLFYDKVSKTFNYDFNENKPWSYIPDSSDRDNYQCKTIEKSEKLI